MPAQHSFATIQGNNVVLTAVKKAEDVDALIFRFFEWAGKTGDVQLSLPRGAKSASLTNLMEKSDDTALSVTNNQVTVPVHPYEIVSVRVEFAQPH
jgi:alpha-mannosidase